MKVSVVSNWVCGFWSEHSVALVVHNSVVNNCQWSTPVPCGLLQFPGCLCCARQHRSPWTPSPSCYWWDGVQDPPKQQLAITWWFCQPPASQAQISTSHIVRGHNRRHRRSVERCLSVGFCGQPWPSAWNCCPTTWLWSTSSTVHPSEPVSDRPRYLPCQPPPFGHCTVRPVSVCGQQQMTHIIDDCLRTQFEADNNAVHWLQTTATKAIAKWNEQRSRSQLIAGFKGTYFWGEGTAFCCRSD